MLNDPSIVLATGLVETTTERIVPLDGHLKLRFEPGLQVGRLREDGSLDFRSRGLLKPVLEGEAIARYIAPQSGRDGKLVTGQIVSARRPMDTRPRLGKGVEEDAEGTIYAVRPGVINYVAGSLIDVVPLFERFGDVDLSSGDLDMEGTVMIRGTIRPHMMVRATGDIAVFGAVENGHVEARGNISITGEVLSTGSGRLLATGDVTVRHAQSANIETKGTVVIGGSAVKTQCRARSIRVGGFVVGGQLRADQSIVVSEAGARRGTAETILVAGMDVSEMLSDIGRRRKYPSAVMRRFRGPRAKRSRKNKTGKVSRERVVADSMRSEQIASMGRERIRMLRAIRVEVRGKLWPGVVIRLGGHILVVEEPTESVEFRLTDDLKGIRRRDLK